MDNNFVTRNWFRATLFAVALSLVVCIAVVPRAAAQDNQRVSPSQAEPAQPPAMQRPDATPTEPKAEPEINSENPQQDMDKQKDQDRDQNRNRSRSDNDNLNQAQVTTFDQFLDKHPEIAQDLRKNPSLVNDRKYVSSHKDLEEFLENHPKIREDLKEHPEAVMSKERRNERRENERQEEQRPPQL